MAEWLKAADCKSVEILYVGSNPTSLNEVRWSPRVCRVLSTLGTHVVALMQVVNKIARDSRYTSVTFR